MTHELPPFSSWPARDQRIWLHGFNAGRESGFLAGWDKAEAPPLTPDQRDRIALLLLRGGRA